MQFHVSHPAPPVWGGFALRLIKSKKRNFFFPGQQRRNRLKSLAWGREPGGKLCVLKTERTFRTCEHQGCYWAHCVPRRVVSRASKSSVRQTQASVFVLPTCSKWLNWLQHPLNHSKWAFSDGGCLGPLFSALKDPGRKDHPWGRNLWRGKEARFTANLT